LNSTRRGPRNAFAFVILIGILSFFADFTYEGARGITGPFLGLLGASALIISSVGGLGELLGYGLRLISGPLAERTGSHWKIAIVGYIVQLTAVPSLAFATTWQTAAILTLLERIGKATRNPPRDAMLALAAQEMGYGWGFGIHEALDQFGASFGPLVVAAVLAARHSYHEAFAVLVLPMAIVFALLALARLSYPKPEELGGEVLDVHAMGLSPTYWIYLTGAGLVAAGFADYSLLAYHFQRSIPLRATMVPVYYAVAMAVSGSGSLLFGKLFDRFGMILLVPLAIAAAIFAPLVFYGNSWAALAGIALWGLGMGVHESIIPRCRAHGVARTAALSLRHLYRNLRYRVVLGQRRYRRALHEVAGGSGRILRGDSTCGNTDLPPRRSSYPGG
jgi:hypothetical protein